jgi:hypothetical protein
MLIQIDDAVLLCGPRKINTESDIFTDLQSEIHERGVRPFQLNNVIRLRYSTTNGSTNLYLVKPRIEVHQWASCVYRFYMACFLSNHKQ